MTPKKIIVESIVTPDVSGYGDKIVLSSNGDLLFNGDGSCCPNPTKPNTTLRWTACYGWVSCTPDNKPLSWRCWESGKHGKCLLINEGGRVPTRNPNANHGGNFFAEAVELHCGFSETWRGSAACITIPPSLWPSFIGQIEIGETGIMRIVDFSNMKCKS
jgi:hypothetical protein